MATPRKEIDLLKGGVQTGEAERSPWVQNLWVPAGTDEWSVRPGFGQVAQIDTGMSAFLGLANTQVNTTPGFYNHLGSKVFTTHFGHEQVLSVFWGTAYGDHQRKNARIMLFAHIQDLETGASWSEPLYRHTAQMEEVSEVLQGTFGDGTLAWFTAHQETNKKEDARHFFSFDASPVFFTVMHDANKSTSVFFGNEQMGLWGYYPINARTQEWHQKHRAYLQTLFTRTCHSGAAESSVVRPITPADGPFSENYTYRSTADFPLPRCATMLNGRLVVADRNTLYFSDAGYPGSFIGSNIEELPVTTPITALGELNGNLLVFTQTETFFYAPRTGALQGAGRLVKVNDEIGCINNNALASTGSELFWVDKSGVYVTNNGLNITEASEQIQSFFRGGTTNPLNHFYQKNGETSLANEQPRTTIDFNADDRVSVTYHEQTGALLIAIPSANMVWCRTKGWSAWTLESIAYAPAGVPAVGVTQNITKPWVMSSKEGIYIVGGPEEQLVVDNAFLGASGKAVNADNVLSSHYILKLGLGGALERSVTLSEDKRHLPGQYDCSTQWAHIHFVNVGVNTTYTLDQTYGALVNDDVYINTGNPLLDGLQKVTVVFGLTIQTDRDSSTGASGAVSGVAQGLVGHCPGDVNFMIVRPPEIVFSETSTELPTAQANIYRVDFEWVPNGSFAGGGDLPNLLRATIAFDMAHWAPIHTAPGSTSLVFDLPSERLHSASLFQVQRQQITGVPDATGPVFMIEYDGTATGANLNLAGKKYNPIVSLYFMHIPYATDQPTSQYGFSLKGGIYTSWLLPTPSPAGVSGQLLVWDPYVVRRHQHDDVAQPVDWAYKTEQLGIKQGMQVRARGTYALLKSRAQPESSVLNTPGWVYGAYNTLLGSDWKDWSSQVIDVDNDLDQIIDKETIRTRIRNTSTSLIYRVFGSARYGSPMNITLITVGATTTLTVAPNHGLVVDDIVTITDSTMGAINGTHTVSAITAPNGFVIGVDTTGLPGAGGTVVLTNAYLIDDEELDTIATSDAVKGESVSYMFFGFMRDIAMGLKIPSLKAILESTGGRRRRGR